MAQAARPLPSAHNLPPAPRLRAVPSPPRAVSRPSAAVIRRRRAGALGGLVALVLLAVGVMSLGGPAGDADRISSLLRKGAADPASLCDHLSSGMLAAAGGHTACVNASPARGPAVTVDGVRVHGDT